MFGARPPVAPDAPEPADKIEKARPAISRKTGIIATLGPATSTPQAIRKLAEAGVNVFRLNFSHGTQEDHGQKIGWIRKASDDLLAQGKIEKPLKVFADIQGPKIRVGKLEGDHTLDGEHADSRPSIALEQGQTLYLSKAAESAEPDVVPVTFPGMIDSLKRGQTVLMDDGKIELKVEAAANKDGKVRCTVVREGEGKLTSNKGINLPNVELGIPALTGKDREDIEFALGKGVDGIAVSFVRTPGDMKEAAEFIRGINPDAKVIAKIEKPEAVRPENLRGIVKQADWIMVARGDLGIETDAVEVPALQEEIIREAKRQGKKAIVATQMLESMMNSKMPSRADVSDIADAVKDGANFVMLSGETAVGQYPADAVQQMARIVARYEGSPRLSQRVTEFFSRLIAKIDEALRKLLKQVPPSLQREANDAYKHWHDWVI